MANRVNVNINVNDHSRAGLAALRQNMNRMQRDVRRAGGRINFNVTVDPGTSRRDLRRIQRRLRGQPVTITTRLDPPTPPPRTMRQRIIRGLGRAVTLPIRLSARGLRSSVRDPVRSIGGFVSGVLQDGVGQGLIQGFTRGGPVGFAALGAILLAAASVLGAALAGALVLAFGGGIVALGAMWAAKSDEFKKSFEKMTDHMAEEMRKVAEPLVPVMVRATKQLTKAFDVLAPKLREFFAEAAPELNDFFDSMLNGFRRFGERAWEPMTSAFQHFLDAFAPHWEGFMGDLGSSFGALGRTVSRHSTEISLALRVVLGIFVALVDIVNFLANTWVNMIKIATYSVGLFMRTMADVMDTAAAAFDVLLRAIGPFAKVMGLGDAVKIARRNLAEWRENTVEGLRAAGQSAMDFGKKLDRANKIRQLKVDIQGYRARLAQARADLKRTASQKARAKLQADISDLKAKIRAANADLNALNGRTAYTTVVTHYDNIETFRAAHGRAMGGIMGAANGGVRSNLTLVGEQGPEMVQLPAGARVRTAGDTRRLMGQGGGGGGQTVVRFDAAPGSVNRMLLRIMREAVRNEGGDFDRGVGIKR
jgi:hypothetical protein